MTAIDTVVRAYLDHLRVERGVSPHTSAAYRRDLDRYADFLRRREVRPDQITSAVVSDYAAGLREGEADQDGGWVRPPLAKSSVARAVVAVRSLHRFALEEGLLGQDPASAVQPPRTPRRLPKALSVAQIQAILDVPDRNTPLGLRDLALLELLYGTGTRITEVVSLDVDEVARAVERRPQTAGGNGAAGGDAATDSWTGLRVLGKGSKERIVPLGSFARSALEAYLVRSRPVLADRAQEAGSAWKGTGSTGRASTGRGSTGTAALFLNARGSRLSRQSAWSILQTSAEKAGVGAHVSPHTMRHSFATHLLDGGADVRVVQELLGHASVTTTQIYTLVTVDHLREVYLGSHPRAY